MISRRSTILMSPVFVLVAGQLTIRLLAPVWGEWSWVPFSILYYLLLGILISISGGMKQVRQWLCSSQGHRAWAILACLVPALMTLPIFIPNWRLLLLPRIGFWTLAFILINPLIEEFYWRGTLLDVTGAWPRGLSVSYAVLGFTLHHLWIGVIAAAGRHPSSLAGPMLMGFVWSVVYKATGSLRWPILGHFLANLFSLTVPVLLNLYIPPGIQGVS